MHNDTLTLGADLALARQGHADHRDHLVLNLDGDGDVHRIGFFQMGNHGTVEFPAIDTNRDLVAPDFSRGDVQPFTGRAIKKTTGIFAALQVDDRRHFL